MLIWLKPLKLVIRQFLEELLAFSYTQGCSSSYKESRQKLGDFGPCNLKSGDPEVILFILLMKLTTATFNSDDDDEIEDNSKKKILPGDTDSNQKVRCIQA